MVTANFSKRIFILITLVGIIGVCSLGTVQAETVLKLHHIMSTTHPYHIGMMKFAESVAEKSNGELKIELFPNGQLGDDSAVLELLKVGGVALANGIPVGKLASFVPEMNLFNLPFLFGSMEELGAFAEGPVGKQVLDSTQKYGFKGLAFHSYVFRYPMNSKRSLNTPADFKGLKIRTMGVPSHIDAYKAIGSNPTPMPFGELFTGLQTGVVDGCENDIATLYTQKFYEVQKYLSLVPVVPTLSTLLMSLQTWNSLSPEQQKVIEESLPPAMEVTNKEYQKLMDEALEKMKAAGVVVTSPEDVQPFIDAVESVYEKYMPELPEDAQKAVTALREK